MPQLNDLQSILLATAAQRDSGSLYPLPDSTANAGARVTKAIATLVKTGFAKERETSDGTAACRIDGDLRYGLFITAAGLAAIGVGEQEEVVTPPVVAAPANAAPRTSKASAVVAMLQRDGGATLPELVAATDWLPKTIRAALTGLRKKGHVVERNKREGATCYRIVTAAA